MKPKSKKQSPYSVKVNSKKQATQVIEYLIDLGFKSDIHWNEVQLNDGWYDRNLDSIFVRLYKDIQIHNHSSFTPGISFEEWKTLPDEEFVIPVKIGQLTDAIKEPKKIIGYKLIKPEYKEAVNGLVKNKWFETHFDENIKDLGYNFCDSDEELSIHQIIKEAGVMHWFKEIYEQSTEQKIFEYIFKRSGFEFTNEEIIDIVKLVNEKL